MDTINTLKQLILILNMQTACKTLIEENVGFPDSSVGKESTCSEGDPGLISGLERFHGEEKGYLLQYSGLEDSMDCIGHEVVKSQT